jgi:hypothetical protein
VAFPSRRCRQSLSRHGGNYVAVADQVRVEHSERGPSGVGWRCRRHGREFVGRHAGPAPDCCRSAGVPSRRPGPASRLSGTRPAVRSERSTGRTRTASFWGPSAAICARKVAHSLAEAVERRVAVGQLTRGLRQCHAASSHHCATHPWTSGPRWPGRRSRGHGPPRIDEQGVRAVEQRELALLVRCHVVSEGRAGVLRCGRPAGAWPLSTNPLKGLVTTAASSRTRSPPPPRPRPRAPSPGDPVHHRRPGPGRATAAGPPACGRTGSRRSFGCAPRRAGRRRSAPWGGTGELAGLVERAAGDAERLLLNARRALRRAQP